MPGNLTHYFQYVSLLTLIQEILNASQLRSAWEWNAPHVSNIYDYITYDADLRLLCPMTINTFVNLLHGRLNGRKCTRC